MLGNGFFKRAPDPGPGASAKPDMGRQQLPIRLQRQWHLGPLMVIEALKAYMDVSPPAARTAHAE
jgi:hypothetical protein